MLQCYIIQVSIKVLDNDVSVSTDLPCEKKYSGSNALDRIFIVPASFALISKTGNREVLFGSILASLFPKELRQQGRAEVFELPHCRSDVLVQVQD